MSLVLFLVVFSSLFVAFSDEIGAWLKNVLAVTWVRVLFPLVVASFLWVWFDEEILAFLLHLKVSIPFFTAKSSSVLPARWNWILRWLGLYFSASVPAWLFYWKLSRGKINQKNMPRLLKLYLFSWLFFVLLILA